MREMAARAMAMVSKTARARAARGIAMATKRARARVARGIATATRVVGNEEADGKWQQSDVSHLERFCTNVLLARLTKVRRQMGEKARPLSQL